jgi:trehalose 6-phosphate synthase
VSSRLIVVSNRVALPKRASAGGLAPAMLAALSERGGVWFGWSGRVVADDSERDLRRQRAGGIDYALLDLTREEYARYYVGFANRILWPLLHFRPSLINYSREDFFGYLDVNRQFAKALAPLLRDDDFVWINDYHLIPLAAELRNLDVGARLGFFLHVPLPPLDLLATLPHHEHLFRTLTAYDLIGLQTRRDLAALLGYLAAECSATLSPEQERYCANASKRDATPRELRDNAVRRIELPNQRSVRVGVFGIGIDTQRIARQAAHAERSVATRRLVESLQGRALAVGVDRIDYSKGLPQRFEGFGRFLAQHGDWQSRVSFMQIAPPSREEVPEYHELRERLERMAGAINGRYAHPDWAPIRYLNRSFQRATLAGFFRVARVALVTPLRDGMNLVAKEYVAAQPPHDPGVLVLSSFAGAADELKQAIVINPSDPEDIVEAISAALTMRESERRERWAEMFEHLVRNDVTAWRNAFLAALEA